jgi:hypothetical protein
LSSGATSSSVKSARFFAWVAGLAGVAVVAAELVSGSPDWSRLISDVAALWMGAALFVVVSAKSPEAAAIARLIAFVLVTVLVAAMGLAIFS